MSKCPGNCGMAFISDKSVDFYRDAVSFVQKKTEQHNCPIFQSRFLNKPTVFVTSNEGVRQILEDESQNMELGYKAFMNHVFGDIVVFSDGEEASKLRCSLKNLFTRESVFLYEGIISGLTSRSFYQLDNRESVPVYSVFKRLSTEICLSIFLDIDFQTSSEMAEEIIKLTTTHWHGIISVPLNFKVPLTKQTSTFGKALEAKEDLLNIIKQKIKELKDMSCKCQDVCSCGPTCHFLKQAVSEDFLSDDFLFNHVLLFTSALVPKALSSLLTSFVMTIAGEEQLQNDARHDVDLQDRIWLEIQRLFPPLLGGRRIVKKDCQIEGFSIPAGHSVVYMSRPAQRDFKIFDEPDKFDPSRWLNKNKEDKDKIFTFGFGNRACIGQDFIWKILRIISKQLLDSYSWKLAPGQDLSYKWLPVSRPREGLLVEFTRRAD